VSCEGTPGPGDPPPEAPPRGSQPPALRLVPLAGEGLGHVSGLGGVAGVLGSLQPLRLHMRVTQAPAQGWPGGLSCCSITVPAGHRGCAGTASCPSPAALPSRRSHACPTGGLSCSPIPPGPGPHLHSKRAAAEEESPGGRGEPRGQRCPERHNSGRRRDVQGGKALQQAPYAAHSPEKPPCLSPSVNEPEIIRADSHLAAVCGYLLRRQVPAQVLPSGARKEFEGEIFSLRLRIHSGGSSSVLLAGQARPQHRRTAATCEQLSPGRGQP